MLVVEEVEEGWVWVISETRAGLSTKEVKSKELWYKGLSILGKLLGTTSSMPKWKEKKIQS